MDTNYKEYPIRCKTCNGQIACFSKSYESLIKDSSLTSEDALNKLGIKNFCCRIAMLNPTIVPFNIENRRMVEGLDSLTESFETISQRIFKSCIDKAKAKQEFQVSRGVSALKALSSRTSISLPKSPKPSTGTIVSSLDITQKSQPVGVGIPISQESTERKEFIEPTDVGVPTINEIPLNELPHSIRQEVIKEINVGNDKKVKVLYGRTYLAR